MYVGNVILLLLSIPLVGIFVRILRIRPAILAPITALITILGAYTINNSTFDVFVMIAFGVLGYLMKKGGFEPGPMVLAFVLGAILENNVRRSLIIYDGDPTGFVKDPISGTILAVFVLVAGWPLAKTVINQPAQQRRSHPRPATTPESEETTHDHRDRIRPVPRRRGGPRGRPRRGRRPTATTSSSSTARAAAAPSTASSSTRPPATSWSPGPSRPG